MIDGSNHNALGQDQGEWLLKIIAVAERLGVGVDALAGLFETPPEKLKSEYLKAGERFLDIVARDAETVGGLGLTNEQIAGTLAVVVSLAEGDVDTLKAIDNESGFIKGVLDNKFGPSKPGVNEFSIEGVSYKVGIESWLGDQVSPIDENAKTSINLNVINLRTGRAVSFSGLMPHFIAVLGFYNGNVEYRLEPTDVAMTFDHLCPEAMRLDSTDPVVEITERPEAATGEAVTLSTLDQVVRYRNLLDAGLPAAVGSLVDIELCDEDRNKLVEDNSNIILIGNLRDGELKKALIEKLELESFGVDEQFISIICSINNTDRKKYLNYLLTAAKKVNADNRRLYLIEQLLNRIGSFIDVAALKSVNTTDLSADETEPTITGTAEDYLTSSRTNKISKQDMSSIEELIDVIDCEPQPLAAVIYQVSLMVVNSDFYPEDIALALMIRYKDKIKEFIDQSYSDIFGVDEVKDCGAKIRDLMKNDEFIYRLEDSSPF